MPRTWYAFLIACLLVLSAIGAGVVRATDRPAAAAPMQPIRMSNGLVLTVQDRARLEADRERIRRHVAELEYRILGPRSGRERRPSPDPKP